MWNDLRLEIRPKARPSFVRPFSFPSAFVRSFVLLFRCAVLRFPGISLKSTDRVLLAPLSLNLILARDGLSQLRLRYGSSDPRFWAFLPRGRYPSGCFYVLFCRDLFKVVHLFDSSRVSFELFELILIYLMIDDDG